MLELNLKNIITITPMIVLSHPASAAKVLTARIASIAAMLLVSCFAIAVIILHFLRTDFNPLQHFVSEYEVGTYSIIMRIAFFCLSAGSLALIVVLSKTIPRQTVSHVALALLFVWSVCVALAGIFPADISGAPETYAGKIHNNASLLGFLAIVIASFLLLRFRRDKRWKSFYTIDFI